MSKIQLLPEHIIGKIAAGEVIERPAYAVKELIENSLDAQATEITIHVEASGLKKIQVIDNGIGMGKEDLLEAYKLHTTSKITDDLFGITSLGFRGEALASIAAVSTLSLKSREESSSLGNEVLIQEGEVGNVLPCGMQQGTQVTVSNLFSGLPARKKFLKSERTEFRHIVDLVMKFSLSKPTVHFTLTHNKKIILDLPNTLSHEEKIAKLFGNSIASQLIPLETEPSYISVNGFIAHPQIASTSQTKQFIFINNRIVSDKLIQTAIREAYGSLLELNHHPFFIIFLTIPFEMIDVNVHPRKEQVHFENAEMVFQTIKLFVTKTLSENNISFTISLPFSKRKGSVNMYAADLLKQSVIPWNVKDHVLNQQQKVITQINNCYILSQTKSDITLVDQHAAHERILFEQYSEMLSQKKQTIYLLPKPFPLNLSTNDYDILFEYRDLLKTVGITFDNECNLLSLPEIVKDVDVVKLFQNILVDLESKQTTPDMTQFLRLMLSYLACRHAVKAGDSLTKKEAERLVKKLGETENNMTCPHGRPTHMVLSHRDLDVFFKRI